MCDVTAAVSQRVHDHGASCFFAHAQIEVHQPIMMQSFRRKFDQDEPPMVNEEASRKHQGRDDPHRLTERYYKWGIKPEWLTIHRVLTHK